MLAVLMNMISRSPVTPFRYLKRLQIATNANKYILRDLIHDSPHLRAAPRTYERVAIGLSDCRVVSRFGHAPQHIALSPPARAFSP
jgi:hypothetical protein